MLKNILPGERSIENQISPSHYPCQKETTFTTQSFIKGIPPLPWRALSKYFWSTENLVPYLPSNLLFLKKSKASCCLNLKQMEGESTHKCLPLPPKRSSSILAHLSMLLEIAYLASFPSPCSKWLQVFPYSDKDDIWELSTLTFSGTSTRMLVLLGRARAPPFHPPGQHPQVAICELLNLKLSA